MEPIDTDYLHGTDPAEQLRLSRLNALLNANSLRTIGLSAGSRVLDVGSGLGQFTRLMARAAGPRGRVVGVEPDADQLAEAIRQARADGEAGLVDFRRGDAAALPLEAEEWGSFDVAHARFVLEHVTDPLAVVRTMARAIRPGGRVVLEDDDHEILRLVPESKEVTDLWRAYYRTYARQGKDPFVGRNLVGLLHRAGCVPRGTTCLFFGSVAGSPNFDAMVDNFVAIMAGAREAMLELGLADERQIEAGLAAFEAWRRYPDAAMWYTTAWASGVRPVDAGADNPAQRGAAVTVELPARTTDSDSAGASTTDEAPLLRFLMNAAAELSSSLDLQEVFHNIARQLLPLIDFDLFAVLLWNDQSQLLEHSFSMKYGEAIPQKGGFPLGYGIGGACAESRRAIRVSDVLEDPRYVRYRHPEVEIRSELAVPLLFQDRLIGVLDLECSEIGYYTEEHEQVVSALASHIATALSNARLYDRVLRDEQRMERDLATARRTQRRLLPQANPLIADVEFGSTYLPALELGGDFYDYRRDPGGKVAITVGDVAGKATAAALLASMTVGLLRGQAATRVFEPSATLAELNESLFAIGEENRFVAMAHAVLDEATRELRVASAGFPRPMHVRGGHVRSLDVGGRPLGMFGGSRYEETSLCPVAGDLIVLSSDGVLESENPREEPFAANRIGAELARLHTGTAQQVADGLVRAAAEFSGGQFRQRDDFTVVVLKFR